MGLVIFDIDGTLTATQEVDESHYAEAIRQVLGITDISTDWGAYPHSTDEAICSHLIQERLGRSATRADLDLVRRRFGALLEQAPQDQFRQIPGAITAIAALVRGGWTVAIASGGWSPTACLKLERGGFTWDSPPVLKECGRVSEQVRPTGVRACAFAEDAHAREEIIRIAATRLPVGLVAPTPDARGLPRRGVYVGDGAWDVDAARKVGYGFVGLGVGARAKTLRRAGASAVFPDYLSLDSFLDAVESQSRTEGICP